MCGVIGTTIGAVGTFVAIGLPLRIERRERARFSRSMSSRAI
jgi:hypothetical protein